MTIHPISIQRLMDQAMIGARADDPVLPERRRRRLRRRRETAQPNGPRCAPALPPRGAY